MSSTESSGAPAEATATPSAPAAAFPSFGSTRGSGLARGKRPAVAPAAASTASSDYKPTAIEVVTAPREYQNPFAPAETPAAVAPEVIAAPAPQAPVAPVAPVGAPDNYVAPAAIEPAAVAPVLPTEDEKPAGLNILEPLQQKATPAQTWESEGFRPAREQRQERPRREESRRDEPRREERSEQPAEPVDISAIPAKFLYVRPGYNYVPTPSNFGGAPRERAPRGEHASSGASAPAPRTSEAPKHSHSSSTAAKPASGGGFFGWLKSLFGGSSETPAAPHARTQSEHRSGGARPQDQQREGGQGRGDNRRRHRGGRGRSGGGGGGHRNSGGSQQGGV
ncbi:hypothetical protein [Oleiharenicola lentus]|uniref:hypothetical protein n=1 Tax=Oleiharenicola lentus TaxID=2508720 RepID=UPI003F66E362